MLASAERNATRLAAVAGVKEVLQGSRHDDAARVLEAMKRAEVARRRAATAERRIADAERRAREASKRAEDEAKRANDADKRADDDDDDDVARTCCWICSHAWSCCIGMCA